MDEFTIDEFIKRWANDVYSNRQNISADLWTQKLTGNFPYTFTSTASSRVYDMWKPPGEIVYKFESSLDTQSEELDEFLDEFIKGGDHE